MEIKKYLSYALCIGLLLTTAGQLQAVRTDEARENMNLFRRSVQSFQRTSERYNRCIRGKCSEKEKRKIRKELHTAAKKALKYGLILAGIVGTGLVLRKAKAHQAATKPAQRQRVTQKAQTPKLPIEDTGKRYKTLTDADWEFIYSIATYLMEEQKGFQQDPSKIVNQLLSHKGYTMANVTDNGKRAAAELYYNHFDPSIEEVTAFKAKFFPTR